MYSMWIDDLNFLSSIFEYSSCMYVHIFIYGPFYVVGDLSRLLHLEGKAGGGRIWKPWRLEGQVIIHTTHTYIHTYIHT